MQMTISTLHKYSLMIVQTEAAISILYLYIIKHLHLCIYLNIQNRSLLLLKTHWHTKIVSCVSAFFNKSMYMSMTLFLKRSRLLSLLSSIGKMLAVSQPTFLHLPLTFSQLKMFCLCAPVLFLVVHIFVSNEL